jgi:hypothetical protein
MKFTLPKLMTEINCEPIGYPGLMVRCWLNATPEPYEPPDDAQSWESPYWYGLGRIIVEVVVPAEMNDTGARQVIDIPDGKALYELMDAEGFDHQIILWAVEQYQTERQERIKVEAKN